MDFVALLNAPTMFCLVKQYLVCIGLILSLLFLSLSTSHTSVARTRGSSFYVS